MSDELKVQAEIRKDVGELGGHAFKLTNRFTIGIPDLAIWLAPFVPAAIEVKDFGDAVPGFARAIGVTPKQRDEMRRMAEAYDRKHVVTGVLVHARVQGARRLYPFRWDAPVAMDGPQYVTRARGGRWDMVGVLRMLGVAQFGEPLCPQTGMKCIRPVREGSNLNCRWLTECGHLVKENSDG